MIYIYIYIYINRQSLDKIQLDSFGYTLLSVSLRPSRLSLCVCVLKIINILKNNYSYVINYLFLE